MSRNAPRTPRYVAFLSIIALYLAYFILPALLFGPE
jgi:hypothetical protein